MGGKVRDEKLLAAIAIAVIVSAVVLGVFRRSGGFLVEVLIAEGMVGSIWYYMNTVLSGSGSGSLLLLYLGGWFLGGYVVWLLLRGILSDRIGNFWVEYGVSLGILGIAYFWLTGQTGLMVLSGILGFLIWILGRR